MKGGPGGDRQSEANWQKVKDAFRGQQTPGRFLVGQAGRAAAGHRVGRSDRPELGRDSGVALIIVGARSGTKVHSH